MRCDVLLEWTMYDASIPMRWTSCEVHGSVSCRIKRIWLVKWRDVHYL